MRWRRWRFVLRSKESRRPPRLPGVLTLAAPRPLVEPEKSDRTEGHALKRAFRAQLAGFGKGYGDDEGDRPRDEPNDGGPVDTPPEEEPAPRPMIAPPQEEEAPTGIWAGDRIAEPAGGEE